MTKPTHFTSTFPAFLPAHSSQCMTISSNGLSIRLKSALDLRRAGPLLSRPCHPKEKWPEEQCHPLSSGAPRHLHHTSCLLIKIYHAACLYISINQWRSVREQPWISNRTGTLIGSHNDWRKHATCSHHQRFTTLKGTILSFNCLTSFLFNLRGYK